MITENFDVKAVSKVGKKLTLLLLTKFCQGLPTENY